MEPYRYRRPDKDPRTVKHQKKTDWNTGRARFNASFFLCVSPALGIGPHR